MGQIGPTHLLVVALVVLVVFGSKRLPDTARALGKSLRILKSEAAALKTEEPQTHQPQHQPQQARPVQPVQQLQHPQQAPEPVHQPPVSS
ncbi:MULTISPECIES: Sec-independent protein translocase subunit TatA [unclassified Streptomyces]|jgi:sec-independent protein translocase protein TatA|uniref:Sec-independent protein translocase subunit TatA n=1 Tax=Streptomyces TaxID=1883 RepID=UPI001937A24F|nr:MULTISPECIES: Sec-independent protein translocase subunit TatA [unclassified Streptomyces]MCU4745990.1 Sec-independent protein translocase subunit TatA [Streptomyces sp. G-5]QQN76323.1 Sec-independent protein translocase subunit TatA [Streptomyces sp. XC 2026]